MGRRLGRLAALVAVLACGAAAAQVKPPPAAGEASPAAPDKFAAPPPPPPGAPPSPPPAEKFAEPVPSPDAPPAPSQTPPAPAPRRAVPDAPPSPPSARTAPANEPAAVARAALRGMDLAAGLSALVASEAPPRPQGGYGLEVEGVLVREGGRPLGGFGALRVSGEVPAAGGPETGSLALRDLRIEPFPGFAEWLRRFGYEAVTADLSAESRYDRAAGRVELTSLSLAGREIGALGLALVLDGVTPKAAERGDPSAMRLVSAALRYVDQSLYGRFVRQQARETRAPEAQVRNGLAETADAALASLGKEPGVDAVRAAVGRFLRGEAREVEITARPAAPLAFTEFGPGPPDAAMLGRLGLGASAR